ncbi:ABC transporter substrate-binding protein [Diplocloster agilis]|uniref:ABC transporter substrate-binding protein n=1 Tax=Diplocloster agilis TaxID=2850323 RepID=UPI000822F352|nr:ABC transporter substrate-binding protein [Suonthocola fibrivorans]MCU6734729.1 ABC transporter substrate-binding protein [Suonthocola fibrivorans]SCJ52179.1 Cyclodextrin-binding protein precursor [uncultured Clostridium sp.]
MRMKKWWSLLIAAVLVGSSLAGCGSKQEEAPEDANAPAQSESPAQEPAGTDAPEAGGETGEAVTLNFWNVFTGSDGDILREIVDKYNETNTDNITINMDIMPNDTLQQKLPASIATNTAPDFVLFGVENIAPYVSNDSLEDISDFWDTAGVDKSNFLENVVDLSYVDGKLYGTPMQYNVQYLYWNKDLFQAAGLDPDTPPATMEELADFAVKLTDSSKKQYGLALPTSVTYMQFLWANGGDADDTETNTNLLNSEENLKTLEWLQDLAVNKKVTPENITGPDADTMLQAGQVAMYMSGPWQINGLNEAGIKFGIAPCVAGSAGSFSPAGGCSFVIPKGTDETKKAAAYKFMKYWLTDEVLKEWSQRNGFPVWSKTLMEDPEIQNDEVLSSISKATEIGRSYNLGYSLASQIDNDVMIPLFEKVITGASKPKDALDEASKAMDAVLGSN